MTDFYDINTMNRGKGAKRFWICYVEGTDGGRHYRHYNLLSAQKEAERLANLPSSRGKQVCLFECIGICEAYLWPVKWEIPR